MALAGFSAGIPAALLLGGLLADADVVFYSTLYGLFLTLFNPVSLLKILMLALFFFLLVYCSLGSACSMGIPKEISEKTIEILWLPSALPFS